MCPQWVVWITFDKMPGELELQDAGSYLTLRPISDMQLASEGLALLSWVKTSPVLSSQLYNEGHLCFK